MATSVLRMTNSPYALTDITIPNGSNLNNYTTPGTYKVLNSTASATIVNAPMTSSGFRLDVLKGYQDSTVEQIAWFHPHVYHRALSTTNVWSEWVNVKYPYRYRANGTLSDASLCAFAWVTTNSTQLSILVPTVTVNNSNFSSVTSLKIQLRKPAGGYLVSENYDIVSYLTSKTINAQGFYFAATKSDGWGVTNNLPLTGAIKLSAVIA